MRRRTQLDVRAIFAPEHGLRGDRPAGAAVSSYVDSQTGLPVYSLYGATRHADAAQLAGIRTLLFDIQDVGSRAYTYISTMAYAMQTARARGIAVLGARPAQSGRRRDGRRAGITAGVFVVHRALPDRHAPRNDGRRTRTAVQRSLRHRRAAARGSDARLEAFDAVARHGLRWVRTSPNVPQWQTTFVLLCTGLIDNAGINNGVGTDTPFFLAGTLGLDGNALADAMNAHRFPGRLVRGSAMVANAGFWKGRTLSGVRLSVDDPASFLPVKTSVSLLVTIRQIAPHAIVVKDPAALDRDWGTDALRLGLLHGLSTDAILAQWEFEHEQLSSVAYEVSVVCLTASTTGCIVGWSKRLGADAVKTEPEDLAVYSFDAYTGGGTPVAVALPASTREVSAVVKIARDCGQPIVARGAGTGLCGGAVPVAGGVVIGTSRMNGVLEVRRAKPASARRAGIDQPRSFSRGTLGRFVLCARSGVAKNIDHRRKHRDQCRRTALFSYGTTVNHVLGLEIVDAKAK